MTNRYGGRHTDNQKNRRLAEYLRAYSIALKNQRFVLTYIDAFAGSGDREFVESASPLLGEMGASDRLVTVPGSARMAIAIEPKLDLMVFIESNRKRFAELVKIRDEHPDRKIICYKGDANDTVKMICEGTPWHRANDDCRGIRAVMFLDPFGMQVGWDTLKCIAKTEAIDLWYFFPLMGLYRQAAKDLRKIDESKRKRLNYVLGTDEWEKAWYATQHQTSLFQDEDVDLQARTADVADFELFVKARLETIFVGKGAVLPPRTIYHDRGFPVASLFVAIANPKSAAIAAARRIAGHILNSGISSHV